MGTDGKAPPLSAKHKESFAYITINKRLPVILAQIADSLCRKKLTIAEQYGEEASEDMKLIISLLSKLRYELQTDKPLTPLQSSAPDLEAWNSELTQQTTANGAPPTWYSATWLYVECYMYRALQDYMALTKVMQDYDLFGDQKKQAYTDAVQPVNSLLLYLTQVTSRLQTGDSNHDLSDLFTQFMQIALWGNRCDLSISQGAENSQKECVLQQLSALKLHILADDTSQTFAALRGAGPARRVDIVLDNAGFELITDLCLAEFLIASGLADSVHLHGKTMPWFVSDVTQQDLAWTLDAMTSSEVSHVSQMGAHWKSRLHKGSWRFSAHQFWTLPYSCCLMERHAPHLHSDLASSRLLIFKGDLNYRKLVGDRAWPPTTPFSLALQGFEPAPLCALRALKADTVAGLRAGLAEEVGKQDDKWMVNGQWAVVSFHGVSSS